jgi:hypothetical protein
MRITKIQVGNELGYWKNRDSYERREKMLTQVHHYGGDDYGDDDDDDDDEDDDSKVAPSVV